MTPRISPAFSVREIPGKSRQGRQCVHLLEPIEYQDDEVFIVVPAGFETDFASVPPYVDGIVPSFGPWARATIIHDFLYDRGGEVPGGPVSRKRADRIFKAAMKLCGVPGWRREIMYRAVRLGGGSGWGR